MTLRTVTTPFDQHTQAEWRATLGSWNGVVFASLSTAAQTETDRLIEEAHELISQRFGHEPDANREWSVTAPSTSDGTFAMPVDLRQVVSIREVDSGGDDVTITLSTKADYWARRNSIAAEPWTDQGSPRYFFDGWDDSNPPKQQWIRKPTPSAAPTVTVYGRCYFGTVASDTYTQLPPSYVPMLRDRMRAEWALFTKDREMYELYSGAAERKIAEMQINGALVSNTEAGRLVGMPQEALDEMDLYG